MISKAEIIVNRCGRPDCGMVYALVGSNRRQPPFYMPEFAGNAPCEKITGHDMSEWTRATLKRDVLILQALWTVGRSVTPGLPSDPTAYILADSIGWQAGDPAMITELPEWFRDRVVGAADLTWPAVILAERVAERVRDQWSTSQGGYQRWNRIVSYLHLWSDRVH